MQTNKNFKNLILIAGILILVSILIFVCIDSDYAGNHTTHSEEDTNGNKNITKFGKDIHIIFTNETFEGIWNGKVISGRKGEQAMDWYARQRNWERIDEEKSPHSPGIDGIYKKFNITYIFIEAKETSWKGDYDRPLSTGASYGPQMSDEWIEHHVIKINNSDLSAAFYDENYEKLVIIYKINDSKGSTIAQRFADSLSNVGVDDVVIIKRCFEDVCS